MKDENAIAWFILHPSSFILSVPPLAAEENSLERQIGVGIAGRSHPPPTLPLIPEREAPATVVPRSVTEAAFHTENAHAVALPPKGDRVRKGGAEVAGHRLAEVLPRPAGQAGRVQFAVQIDARLAQRLVKLKRSHRTDARKAAAGRLVED